MRIVPTLLVLALATPPALPLAQAGFAGCGTVVQGVTCVLFAPDAGGLYILENLGGFQVGQRAHVAGAIDPNCISFCLQGDGCILGNTITDCSPGTPFCAGDGLDPVVTTPCPCGNSGAQGHGCASSVNPAGAELATSGSVPSDDVALHGAGMPATVGTIYFKGDASAAAGVPFGDGVRCADGTLIRLATKINVAGASQFPEPGDPLLSVRGQTPVGSGLVGYYQAYYRNAAAAFCPPETFNATNGQQVTW